MRYPYIDKEYYPAVMFMCKLIREDKKEYNTALRIASGYYKVDSDIVKHYFDERSHFKSKNSGYKMKWFVIGEAEGSCEDTCVSVYYRIVRGKTEESVRRTLSKQHWEFDMANDTGGYCSLSKWTTLCEEFDSKEEAEARLLELKQEIKW